MQIKKSLSNKKKKIIIVAIVAVLAISGTASALVITHINNGKTKTTSQQDKKSTKGTSSKDSVKSDKETDSADDNTSKDSSDTNKNNSSSDVPTLDSGDGKEPKQYESQGTADDPANSKVISGGVNNKSVNGNTLHISATIFQTIPSGNGVLTLTGPQGQTYTTTTDLYNSPSGATMVAYDIPLDKLGGNRSGNWAIKITVDNKDYSGDIEDSVNL